eukprot:CAMPEP_0171600766 /NCGR_PEP_ID=MMETSP0990-20121206/4520_1 /TAXON_ID=483369 /ORGANISM="non described non described, Strain CCMP2098" /LENGTH=75 /DNA_ID=CAMNT_0012162789 /DNA_START=153 /DNA_END=380 /DNA_ORIENTATION=-
MKLGRITKVADKDLTPSSRRTAVESHPTERLVEGWVEVAAPRHPLPAPRVRSPKPVPELGVRSGHHLQEFDFCGS